MRQDSGIEKAGHYGYYEGAWIDECGCGWGKEKKLFQVPKIERFGYERRWEKFKQHFLKIKKTIFLKKVGLYRCLIDKCSHKI